MRERCGTGPVDASSRRSSLVLHSLHYIVIERMKRIQNEITVAFRALIETKSRRSCPTTEMRAPSPTEADGVQAPSSLRQAFTAESTNAAT